MYTGQVVMTRWQHVSLVTTACFLSWLIRDFGLARKARQYLNLVEEKDEADRLADVARERLRRSLRS